MKSVMVLKSVDVSVRNTEPHIKRIRPNIYVQRSSFPSKDTKQG